MSDPLVSIVIPTYNRADFLAETLACVHAQDYTKKEIIVIDDGSMDATPEICARHKARHVWKENGGAHLARLAGASLAAGELIMFLDDDDLLPPGSLRTRVEHWTASPGCDAVIGRTRRFHGLPGSAPEFLDDEQGILIINLGATLFSRRACGRAEAAGGALPTGRGDDVDLWLRISETGARRKIVDDVCLLYRLHAGNATGGWDSTGRGLLGALHSASLRRRAREFPAVSVVMPVYNGEGHLRASVESVLAQKGVRVELIIVDGGSTDGTAAIAETFGESVRYFRNGRDTLAIAKNFGIARASHPLIAFMAGDDLWPPDKLAKQARWLAEHPAAEVCGCRTRHFLHEGCAGWPSNFILHPPDAEMSALIPETLLCRREVFERVGLFDESFLKSADDVDWISRVQHAGVEIGMLPEVLLLKGIHARNVTYSRPGVQGDLLRALHGRVRRKEGR